MQRGEHRADPCGEIPDGQHFVPPPLRTKNVGGGRHRRPRPRMKRWNTRVGIRLLRMQPPVVALEVLMRTQSNQRGFTLLLLPRLLVLGLPLALLVGWLLMPAL